MKNWWRNIAPISHLASSSIGALENYSIWGLGILIWKMKLNLDSWHIKALKIPKNPLSNHLFNFKNTWDFKKSLNLAETTEEYLQVSIDGPDDVP